MKRPEGFDGGRQQPPPPSRETRTPRAAKPARSAPRPTTPARATPEPAPAKASAPTKAAAPANAPAQTPRRARPGVDGAARPRSARAEFAAADRRRKREERAEVRRFTRSARRRRIGWASGAIVLVLLSGLVVTAVFSPILALRTVTIDGTQRLDPAALVDAVDGQLGTPLALLDEGRIRNELGEFTLIRSYVTELVPPGTLLIHIVERAPIGVISAADGYRLVDPAGVVIDTTVTQPAGYPLMELDPDDDTSGAGFRSMAEVLLALPPSVAGQVLTISARTRDDVTLTLTGSAQRVVWGSADGSTEKAAVLAGLIALHAADGPGEYDVSAPGIGVFRKD
ncbi:MAG: FtsQ-type POTRA domain-containing protein [Pseudolysinimonas sp.]